MNIRCLTVLVLLFSLVGCAIYQPVPTALPLNPYQDDVISPQQALPDVEQIEDIFELPNDVKRQVQQELSSIEDYDERAAKFIDLFFSKKTGLAYRSNANYTAEEVNSHNTANCLSLTIYARAIANLANINTSINHIDVLENWTIENGYTLLNDHVHLRVLPENSVNKPRGFLYVVDFITQSQNLVGDKTTVDDTSLSALYYNNKGASALTQEKHELAYAYLKQATITAPQIANGWINLAILYRRFKLYALAEDIYLYALTLEPGNLNALENLAYLYAETDRPKQSKDLLKKVSYERRNNPFFLAMQADRLYLKGGYRASLSKFKKAIRANPNEHSFYFGVAKNYMALNQPIKAEKYARQAQRLQQVLIGQ